MAFLGSFIGVNNTYITVMNLQMYVRFTLTDLLQHFSSSHSLNSLRSIYIYIYIYLFIYVYTQQYSTIVSNQSLLFIAWLHVSAAHVAIFRPAWSRTSTL